MYPAASVSVFTFRIRNQNILLLEKSIAVKSKITAAARNGSWLLWSDG